MTIENKKQLVLDTIRNANAKKLQNYLYDIINSIPDDDFIEGHDNGYDDGYGALKDIYISNLLIDCTLLQNK